MNQEDKNLDPKLTLEPSQEARHDSSETFLTLEMLEQAAAEE